MFKKQLFIFWVVMFVALLAGATVAAVIDGSAITATESDDDWGQFPASNLVNGMGLDANGLTFNMLSYGTWIGQDLGYDTSAAPNTTVGPAWVKFVFDDIYKLGEVWVWNGNLSGIGADYGMRNVIVEYSVDGTTWYTKGTYEFPKGTGTTDYTGFSAFNFNGTSAKYVVFTAAVANGNWGYPNVYMLSEVRFNGTSDYATQASPNNNALEVSINGDLGWVKGDSAAITNGQQVYFGTSYYGVSTATTTIDPCGVYKGTQSTCSYDPGTLAYGKTYYWRVDEVNGGNSWKGCVRQFTTNFNDSVHWGNITATASNDYSGAYPASLAKDGSGLDATRLLNSTEASDMWLALSSGNSSATPDTVSGPAWIMFEFDHVCELEEMWVWNCNDGVNKARGLRDVVVEYSPDGDTWYELGDYTFTQASGSADDPGFSACDFNGAKAKYVVITAKTTNGNWGGSSYYSLSEVRFYGSQSQTVNEVQSGVPWTMQYDVDSKKPSETDAVSYSDGTTGSITGVSTGYASADANYLTINTSGTNTWCYFSQPTSNGHIDISSTTGYTVEWRVKLLDTSASDGRIALLASFCDAWLSTSDTYDYDHSGTVDFSDFATFASTIMWTENLRSPVMGGSPEANKLWYADLRKHDGKIWADQYYRTAGSEVVVDNDASNPAFHILRVTVENSVATLYVDGIYASSAPLHSGSVIPVFFGDPTSTADANFITDYFYIYDGGGITPKEFREPAKDRKRRVIFDNDGDDMLMYIYNPTVQEFWDTRSTGLIGTQTDTIVYCPTSSGFGQFTYNTAIGDILTSKESIFYNNKTQDFIDQGTDSLEMAVDFCRNNDFEIFFEMRMNDIHDGWGAEGWDIFFNPLKEDNPSWLFGANASDNPVNGRWTGVDYTESGIRSYAYQFVEEVCQNYDVDGVMLDFFRHPVFFQSHADGGEASSAEKQMMTDLITDIREMADREGLKRGKPILVGIRTPDDTVYAGKIGLDIATWMANSLIDLWVPTGYYRIDDMEDSIALGHQYGVKVYPCLSDPRLSDTTANASRTSNRAYYAEAQNWFHSGADGMYSFNYFYNHVLSNAYPRLRYIGDVNTLAGLDKTYSTSMLGYGDIESAPFYLNGGKNFWSYDFVAPEKTLALPASTKKTMNILIGENVAAATPDVLLRLRFAAAPTASDLAVTFNDHSLAGHRRLELNSSTGYTVKWRIKLTEADTSTGGYAGVMCSPEPNNYWYVYAQQHDNKNWVVLNDGSEIQLDSDKNNPAYHTLHVTAYNGYAKLYIDGASSPAAIHAFHAKASSSYLTFGDLTSTPDANSYFDYVYACDDGAYAPAEPSWTMRYDVNGKKPSDTNAVSYSDGTTGNITGVSTGYASADANYLTINTSGTNTWCYFSQPTSNGHINISSTTGYTVEWRVKLLSTDTATANLACSIGGSPEANKLWYADLRMHDGKIWADQYYRTAGSEVVVDNDANNPDFHTLRVTVENSVATLYVDGIYASSAPLHSGSVTPVFFGDPTSTPDANFITDYFYIYDGGAVAPETPWTARYEASSLPSSNSACSYSDGTTGPLTVYGEFYSSVYTLDSVQKILHIDTKKNDSNAGSYFSFENELWIRYPVNAANVNDGWNKIEMTLGDGKPTATLEDLLVEVDY